ncbi:GvpL/GvpF family gas vesicle protein [Kitasatospora sp. NPDC051914]|uniref:GvpL/GvpF family gas vesicle protein n=1 Tax=Kitasatospora sp. NPDC051914 TaxID=3154945 RepID=UPI00341B5094
MAAQHRTRAAPIATGNGGVDPQACYVYGIVPAGTPLPDRLQGVTDPSVPVELVGRGRVAAVVSTVPADRPLGTAADLRAHADVLDTLAAARNAVLPMRFGAVLRDTETVTEDLLDPYEEEFHDALQEIEGHAQFTVRCDYREDELLREILVDREDIARLRDDIAALSEEAGRYHRIRLGELVAGEVAARRDEDAAVLADCLAPHAAAIAPAEPGVAEQGFSAAFLVRDGARTEFEQAAEGLARRWAGRLRVRLLGPIAPYDFAARIAGTAEGDG